MFLILYFRVGLVNLIKGNKKNYYKIKKKNETQHECLSSFSSLSRHEYRLNFWYYLQRSFQPLRRIISIDHCGFL